MSYIGKNYSDFEILASTSLEYKTIWEYQNFIHFHNEIKQIIPSHDVNKNFLLLKSLRKRYPAIKLELIVNEGCLKGCPNRMFHEMLSIDTSKIINNDICLSKSYGTFFCEKVLQKYPIQSLIIGNLIFPWEIQEYQKIGICNFKLVGRDGYLENFEKYINSFTLYLKGVENIKNIENCALSDFTHHLNNNNPVLKELSVKKYIKYLPDIKYFVKNGHKCSVYCGNKCKYCYKCAEKVQKIFNADYKIMRKRNIPSCVITNN